MVRVGSRYIQRFDPASVEKNVISRDAKFTVSSHPYNHLIVEDLFDEGTAYALSAFFNDVIRSGRQVGKVGEEGSLIYEAINFTPSVEHIRHSPVSQIASTELKNLLAEVFDLQLDENLMVGMHRHNPPSKAGWTHTDFAIVSFPNIPPNHGSQRVYFDGCGGAASSQMQFEVADYLRKTSLGVL